MLILFINLWNKFSLEIQRSLFSIFLVYSYGLIINLHSTFMLSVWIILPVLSLNIIIFLVESFDIETFIDYFCCWFMFIPNLCNSIVHISLQTILSAKSFSLKYFETFSIFTNLVLPFQETWVFYWLGLYVGDMYALLILKTFRTILSIIVKYTALWRQQRLTLRLVSGLNGLLQLIIVLFLLYLKPIVYSLTLSGIFYWF